MSKWKKSNLVFMCIVNYFMSFIMCIQFFSYKQCFDLFFWWRLLWCDYPLFPRHHEYKRNSKHCVYSLSINNHAFQMIHWGFIQTTEGIPAQLFTFLQRGRDSYIHKQHLSSHNMKNWISQDSSMCFYSTLLQKMYKWTFMLTLTCF